MVSEAIFSWILGGAPREPVLSKTLKVCCNGLPHANTDSVSHGAREGRDSKAKQSRAEQEQEQEQKQKKSNNKNKSKSKSKSKRTRSKKK